MANQFDPIIAQAATKYGIDPDLLRAGIQVESSFNPAAVSTKGAIGIAQFMPATAKSLGIDPKDPAQSIDGMARLYRENLDRFGGNVDHAVMAYQAGPNPKAWGKTQSDYADKVAAVFNGIKKDGGFIPSAPAPQQSDSLIPAPTNPSMGQAASDSIIPPPQVVQPAQEAKPSLPPAKQAAPSFQGSKLGGFVQGLRDPLDAGAQMLYNALPTSVQQAGDSADAWLAQHTGGVLGNQSGGNFNQKIQQDNASYEAARQANGRTGVDVSRIGGNMVGMAPIALATDGAAIPSFAGRMALGGAASNMLAPVTNGGDNFWQQKAIQGGEGALGGVAGGYGMKALGAVANPVIDAGKQALINAGVKLTPGQLVGGMAHTIEDKLTSVPVLGDIIKGAQGNGVTSLNTAVYNRVLQPLNDAGFNVSLPKTVGRDAVDSVSDQVSNAYNTLLPKLSFKPDAQFNSELGNIKQMAAGLAEPQAKQFNTILQNKLFSKMTPQGNMSGESLKAVESDLNTLARGYQSDPAFDNRQLGDALQSTLQTMRSSLARTNPDYAPQLSKVNEAFANLVRLQKAAASTGAKDGVFTPAQLSQAVRSSDSTVRKNAFARGNAMMQDLADPAKSVLSQTIPDSGTAGRGFIGLAGAAAAGGHFVNPAIPVAAGIAALPYTGAGSRLFQAAMTQRPQLVRRAGEFVTNKAAPLGLLSVPALNGLLK